MSYRIPNLSVLVVEDEHFMRMLIVQALESLGVSSVHDAEDGSHALQVMATEHINFVITDIEMRPQNGLELTQMVRAGKTPIDPATRVIFLTGLGDMSTLSAASELDVHGFMLKPFSAKQLQQKMQEALNLTVRLRDPAVYEALVFSPAEQHLWENRRIKNSGYTVTTTRAVRPEQTAPLSTPGHAAPTGDHEQSENARRMLVALEDLQPGMTLCEDILAGNVAMLRKGMVLQPGFLLVLRDMRELLDKVEWEVELPLVN